jgi:tetratricopeptide (TPR) repeat protein
MLTEDLAKNNTYNLRRLMASVKASLGQLNLLIGICDNLNYRHSIVHNYEAELVEKGVRCYQISLSSERISLRQALEDLVNQEPNLLSTKQVLVTVLADELLGIRLQQPKSAREAFVFSLQWTREALQDFQFPIVLWLSTAIAKDLATQAPDFWSWRGGVFEFEQLFSRTDQTEFDKTLIEGVEVQNTPNSDFFIEFAQQIKELKELIKNLQAQDPHSPLLASLYNRLADLYQNRLDQGTFEDYQQEQSLAIQALHSAIALQEAQNLQAELASSLNNLALLYSLQGHYGEAEPLYKRALAIGEQHLGVKHPNVATSLNNLAGLYESQGRYSEAEPLYTRALAIQEQLEANYPDVATSLNNLAELYRLQGRYSEAEPLYTRALAIREQQLGINHPDVATSLNNLALLYSFQRRYCEAEPLYMRALEILEQQLGDKHPNVATSLNNLAGLYESQGRYGEAEPLYVRALEILEQQLGDKHPNVAASLNNLAGLYESQGRYGEAESLYVRSLEIWEQQLRANHPDAVPSLNNLAELYRLQGRYSEAEPLYTRCLEILFSMLGENHPDTQITWSNFIFFLQQVIAENRTPELSDHPLTQKLLADLRQQAE